MVILMRAGEGRAVGVQVAVAGASGYAGGELLFRIYEHHLIPGLLRLSRRRRAAAPTVAAANPQPPTPA
jgi:N-acetyl-gamma-glutamylphosphate reductase